MSKFGWGWELAVPEFGRGREFHKPIAKIELFRTYDLSLFLQYNDRTVRIN
jgi:hypothetical protein